MKNCKKYISVFLLFVFTWVVLPSSFVHEFFANHRDTECLGHSHDISQLEPLHKHCDVFKTNVPLYNTPGLVVFEKPSRILVAEFDNTLEQLLLENIRYTSYSRGPPVS